VQISN
jgi:hypothetical protein